MFRFFSLFFSFPSDLENLKEGRPDFSRTLFFFLPSATRPVKEKKGGVFFFLLPKQESFSFLLARRFIGSLRRSARLPPFPFSSTKYERVRGLEGRAVPLLTSSMENNNVSSPPFLLSFFCSFACRDPGHRRGISQDGVSVQGHFPSPLLLSILTYRDQGPGRRARPKRVAAARPWPFSFSPPPCVLNLVWRPQGRQTGWRIFFFLFFFPRGSATRRKKQLIAGAGRDDFFPSFPPRGSNAAGGDREKRLDELFFFFCLAIQTLRSLHDEIIVEGEGGRTEAAVKGQRHCGQTLLFLL